MRKSILRLFIKLDKLVNGFLLGDPKETISNRFARNVKKTWVADLGCEIIAFVLRDPEHCKKSFKLKTSQVDSNDNPVILFLILILIIITAYYGYHLFLY